MLPHGEHREPALTAKAARSSIANVEMAATWDGPEGDHWVEFSERYDTATRRHRARLLAAADIAPESRVLDVGCGTGRLAREAAALAPAGTVSGIDLSARMIDRARTEATAAGITNVAFEQGDAHVHPFDEASFDRALSGFATMFFSDPVAAFTNIARAIHPGGQLAMLTWQNMASNEWVSELRTALAAGRALPEPPAGAPGPFSLSDPDHLNAILRSAGFTAVHIEPVDEPIEFGRDADDAFSFVLGIVKGLTKDLDEATRAAALDAVHETYAATRDAQRRPARNRRLAHDRTPRTPAEYHPNPSGSEQPTNPPSAPERHVMMSRSRRLLALCVLATSVLSLIAAAAPASAGDKPVLARVKAATAACHDPVAAQAAGYIPTKTASRCPGWAGRDRSALGQPDADHRGPIIAGLPTPRHRIGPTTAASLERPTWLHQPLHPPRCGSRHAQHHTHPPFPQNDRATGRAQGL